MNKLMRDSLGDRQAMHFNAKIAKQRRKVRKEKHEAIESQIDSRGEMPI